MDIQELKSLLQSVGLKEKQLRKLAARRDEIIAAAALPSCGCYEGSSGNAKGYKGDKIGGAIAKAAAIDEQLAAVYDDYITTYKTAREFINTCEPFSAALLRYRYLIGQDWATLASALGISPRYAMRLHKKALKQLAAVAV